LFPSLIISLQNSTFLCSSCTTGS